MTDHFLEFFCQQIEILLYTQDNELWTHFFTETWHAALILFCLPMFFFCILNAVWPQYVGGSKEAVVLTTSPVQINVF